MEEIAKQVYVETVYDGVNVGAMITPTGVICVDVPSYARDARDWAARMHRLSPYPVLNIILTDSSGDRILNTRWLNAPIIMQQGSADLLGTYEKRYPQHLMESLAQRNPHRGRELSGGAVEHPTMSFSGEMVMFKHGQQIVFHSAIGPNPGTAWIILPERGVLFAGDTLMADTHPLFAAGTSAEWLKTLDALRPYARTHTIMPGRGPVMLAGSGDAIAAIDASVAYIKALRERVSQHIQVGLPKESLTTYVLEFLAKFPLGSLPKEWMEQQIQNSLDYLYDEVQSDA